MAYVKAKWRSCSKSLEKYLTRDKVDPSKLRDFIYDSVLLNGYNFSDEFIKNQQFHKKTRGNQAFELIQSFSPQESKTLTAREINQIGKELITKAYPGFQGVVITHLDEKHIHNHIVIDPVNVRTGVRMNNKKFWLGYSRDNSDQIVRSKGLSVIEPKEKQIRPHSKAIMAHKHRKGSYIIDMKEKIEFTQKYARNFSEMKTILDGFGIDLSRITKQTTSFTYPGAKKAKRGSKISSDFSNQKFKEQHKNNSNKLNVNNIMTLVQKDPQYSKLRSKIVVLKTFGAEDKREFIKNKFLSSPHKSYKIGNRVFLKDNQGKQFFLRPEDKEFEQFKSISKPAPSDLIRTYKKNVFIKNYAQAFMLEGEIFLHTKNEDVFIIKKNDPEYNNIKAYSSLLSDSDKIKYLNKNFYQDKKSIKRYRNHIFIKSKDGTSFIISKESCNWNIYKLKSSTISKKSIHSKVDKDLSPKLNNQDQKDILKELSKIIKDIGLPYELSHNINQWKGIEELQKQFKLINIKKPVKTRSIR